MVKRKLWLIMVLILFLMPACSLPGINVEEQAQLNPKLISVKDKPYQAVGDGKTDDTQAIQCAINDSAGIAVVYFPAGTYKILSTINIPSNSVLQFIPGQSIIDASKLPDSSDVFKSYGTEGESIKIIADAHEGESSINVADAAGFSPEDWCIVKSDTLSGADEQKIGEIVQIYGISGSTITFYDSLCDSYKPGDDAKIARVSFVENITIKGATIIGHVDANKQALRGLRFVFGKNITVENCNFIQTHLAGISFTNVISSRVSGCHFERNEREGFAYGVEVGYCSQDISIQNCTGIRLRHLVTIGGGKSHYGIPRRISATGCVVSQLTDAGFDIHAGPEDIIFSNNIIYGADIAGITLQGTRFNVTGNVLNGIKGTGIYVQHCTNRPLEGVISNNIIRGVGSAQGGSSNARGILVTPSGAEYNQYNGLTITDNVISKTVFGIEIYNDQASPVKFVTISNNIITNPEIAPIRLCNINKVNVANNTMQLFASQREGIYMEKATDSIISGNVINCITSQDTIAIRLLKASDITVAGNRGIKAEVGILMDNETINCLIVNNNMHDCSTPLQLGSGSGHTVSNNKI